MAKTDRGPLSQFGKPIPRIVNTTWMVKALRQQADATTRGDWLPWEPVALLVRAANVIELCCPPGSSQRRNA